MSFVHPFLLWGAILGLIPVAIHILWRRRFRRIRWAAVDFLLAALSRRSRRVAAQDAVLLCLRVLALAAAALVVARPVLSPAAARSAGLRREPVDAVVIVDTSVSMGTVAGGQARANGARTRVRELLRFLPEGSRAALVRTDDPGAPAPARLSPDLALVAAAADGIDATASGAGVEPAFGTALRILDGSRAPRRGLYLITDAQARLFEDAGPRLASMLRGADPVTDTTMMIVPNGRAANLAVASLRIASRWLAVGAPVEIEATIEDPGEPPTREAGVELLVDGRKVARALARLADRTARVTFDHTFTTPGTYALEARLDPDALEADNHRHLAVHVPASMDIAMFSATVGATGEADAHVYVEAALTPGGSAGARDLAAPPFNVRPRLSRDLSGKELARALDDDVWVVVLADPGPLPAELVDRMRAFVFHGGAAFVASGPDAARSLGPFRSRPGGPDAWLADVEAAVPEAVLAQGGAPLRLDVTGIAAAAAATAPNAVGTGDVLPLLDPVAAGLPEAIAAVAFFRALDIRTRADSAWSVALSFNDGRPALLAREHVGAGRLLLFASTLDSRWSDLPYRPAMVPFIAECFEWLARDRQVGLEILPGQVWTLAWLAADAAAPNAGVDPGGGLAVARPDGTTLAAESFVARPEGSQVNAFRFDLTTQPGTYRLGGTSFPETFGARAAAAVNIDVAESSQRVWTAGEIIALLPEGRGRAIGPDMPLDPSAIDGAPGLEIWPHVAAALGCILLLECLLGWLFALQGAPAGKPGRAHA